MLNFIDKVTRAVALYLGGIVLATLMTVIIVDVTGRYLFNSPLYGSLDMTTVLLVLSVACAIGYGGRTGAHVTADMLTSFGSPTFDRVSGILIKVFAAAIVSIWSYRLYVTGTVSGRLAESTQLLGISFEPIYKALAAGVGLYAIVLVIEAITLIRTGSVPLLMDESRGMRSEDE